MRIAAIAIAAVALAGMGTAASARVSDVDYIQASRCGVLAGAAGGESAEALAAYVKSEGRSRNIAVKQMADQAVAKAKRDTRSDSAEKRASLEAELGGVCQAFIGADKTTGQAAKPNASPAS